MDIGTRLRPELDTLQTYNSGLTLADIEARFDGPVAKLGSNENPYGASPGVAQAIVEAARDVHLYPDPVGCALSVEIAWRTGVDPAQVILGDGSEDLLNTLARCLLRSGDEVVTLYPSFPLHEDYATMMGAGVTRVGLTTEGRIDVPALISEMARGPRLVVFANPMNPSGAWLSPEDLDAVLDAQHPGSVLCLDEAYVEYALGEWYLPGTERISSHNKPMLILRTFSKAYGLAGLRVGYGMSNDAGLLRGMHLVRTPFNVNMLAQAAAVAALRGDAYVRSMVATVTAERARLAEALQAMGLNALPSRGNFLFVDGGQSSGDLAEALIDHGVIVKPWRQEGYERFLRVSIGLPRENDQFLGAMAHILQQAPTGSSEAGETRSGTAP